jgi:hypothetical protein
MENLKIVLSPKEFHRVNMLVNTPDAMPERPHRFVKIMAGLDIISTMPTVALYGEAKEILFADISVRSPWQGRLDNPANPPNAVTYAAAIDSWRSFWKSMLRVPDDKLSFAYATPDQTFRDFLDANIIQSAFVADTSHIIRILMGMNPWDNPSTTWNTSRNRLTTHLEIKEDNKRKDSDLKVKGFGNKMPDFWVQLDAVLEVKLGVLAEEVCHCNPILSPHKQFISTWEHSFVDMLADMHRAWTSDHDFIGYVAPPNVVNSDLVKKLADEHNVDLDATGVRELINGLADEADQQRRTDAMYNEVLPPFPKFHLDC